MCVGCGYVSGMAWGRLAPHRTYGPCPRCGRAWHADKVSTRQRKRFGQAPKLDIKYPWEGDPQPTKFHVELAEMLGVECDGGDDPAAVVAGAMEEAAEKCGYMANLGKPRVDA